MTELFQVRELTPQTLPVATLRALPSPYAAHGVASRQAALRLGATFGVTGELHEEPALFRLRGEGGTLEIARPSGGFRFWAANAQAHRLARVEVSDERAVTLAETFLARHGLLDDAMGLCSVERSSVSVGTDDTVEPTQMPVAVFVDYGFSALGFEVIGPGAKMRVTITGKGHVTQLHRSFRPYEIAAWKDPLPVETALARFRQHPCFSDLDADTDRVVIERVFPAYYAASPRQAQVLLAPEYVFRGHVSTPTVPRFAFLKRLPAIP
jgi:hypothetical protein